MLHPVYNFIMWCGNGNSKSNGIVDLFFSFIEVNKHKNLIYFRCKTAL